MSFNENSLLDNILQATNNIPDIRFTRHANVIKINKNNVTVTEEDSDLTHDAVTLVKNLKQGDKVIIGFVDNNLHDPYIVGVIGGTESNNGGSLVGTFYIDNEGYLHVKLPKGTSNPYYIDENGYLHYTTCER